MSTQDKQQPIKTLEELNKEFDNKVNKALANTKVSLSDFAQKVLEAVETTKVYPSDFSQQIAQAIQDIDIDEDAFAEQLRKAKRGTQKDGQIFAELVWKAIYGVDINRKTFIEYVQKISGNAKTDKDKFAQQVEEVMKATPNSQPAFAERVREAIQHIDVDKDLFAKQVENVMKGKPEDKDEFAERIWKAIQGIDIEKGKLAEHILKALHEIEPDKPELLRWDDEVFKFLRDVTGCDHVTLRICGEVITKEDPIQPSSSDNSDMDRLYRPMWAYSGYVIGNEGIYGEPLSRVDQSDYLYQIVRNAYKNEKIIIYKDPTECENDPNLSSLKLAGWIGLPLYLKEGNKKLRLIGILTLDKKGKEDKEDVDFKLQSPVYKLPSSIDTKEYENVDQRLRKNNPDLSLFLIHCAEQLAIQLHESFEHRRSEAKKTLLSTTLNKVERSSLLKQITDELIMTLDPDRLRGIITCELFRRAVPADFASDKLAKKNTFVRWYPEVPQRQFDEDSDAVFSWVLRNKSPRIVFDMSEKNTGPERILTPYKSMLIVPIFAPQKPPRELSRKNNPFNDQRPIVAVVTLNSHLVNRFSYYDLLLVQEVMEQAAAVIARSSLLRFLEDISLEIAPIKPLEKMIYSMLGSLHWLFNDNMVNGLLLISLNDNLYHVTSDYHLFNFSEENRRKSDEKPVFSNDQKRQFAEFLVKHLEGDEPKEFTQDELSKQELIKMWLPKECESHHVLMMPVRFEHELQGILYVSKQNSENTNQSNANNSSSNKKGEEDTFVEIERVGLKKLAEYVGVALHNTYMTQQLKKLESATWQVMRSKNLYEAMQIIADMARELTKAQVSYVALLGPDKKTIKLKAASLECGYYIDEPPILSIGCETSSDGIGLTGRVIRTREPIIFSNAHVKDPEDQKRYPEYHEFSLYDCKTNEKIFVHTELVIPILLPDDSKEPVDGNPAMGALTIDEVKGNDFNSDDLEIIKRFATVAAIAIQHNNHPAHPLYTARFAPEYESDIFVALKFTPKGRCRWVMDQVEAAAKLAACERYSAMPCHNRNQMPYNINPRPRGAKSTHVNKLLVKKADATYCVGEEVWSYIASCDLFIADMWGDSINVYYEIGMAHALNKPVILIGAQQTRPPADLGDVVYITYSDPLDGEDRQFQHTLSDYIGRLLPRITTCNCQSSSELDCSESDNSGLVAIEVLETWEFSNAPSETKEQDESSTASKT